MVVIFDVVFHNIKLSLDCSPIQWSVAFVVFGVDVTEAENVFVPNGNVEMTKDCSHMQYSSFTLYVVRKDNWVFVLFVF